MKQIMYVTKYITKVPPGGDQAIVRIQSRKGAFSEEVSLSFRREGPRNAVGRKTEDARESAAFAIRSRNST